MNSEEFKSTLVKLRPVVGEMADTFWLAAILDPAQAMATELLEERYIGRHITPKPPPEEHSRGESVTYAGRPVCPFG